MSKFIELTYKESREKFFVNIEYITNFQEWDGNTMICLMPHFEPDPDWGQPAPPAPFIVIVQEIVDDVLMLIENAK